MSWFGRKKIDDIANIDELFVVLKKRIHWSRIPEPILQQIFDNAHGDIAKVQRFRFVAEQFHCVENNFLPILEDDPEPRMAVSLFSVTLERVAAQSALLVPQLPAGSREQDMAIGTAETAYMSSILCNPFMLPSYVGLACFYGALGSAERAIDVCRDFDVSEKELFNRDDSDLGYYDRAMKEEAARLRVAIDRLRAELRTQ